VIQSISFESQAFDIYDPYFSSDEDVEKGKKTKDETSSIEDSLLDNSSPVASADEDLVEIAPVSSNGSVIPNPTGFDQSLLRRIGGEEASAIKDEILQLDESNISSDVSTELHLQSLSSKLLNKDEKHTDSEATDPSVADEIGSVSSHSDSPMGATKNLNRLFGTGCNTTRSKQ